MYLITSVLPNRSMLSAEGKWRLSQMSKHFPVNITILDTGHFINFNIHFCSTALWYSCDTHSPSLMVTLWKRWGIKILILFWHRIHSYFLYRFGCYFLADAFRLTHMKFTHCLELSRGRKEDNKDRKRWREKWDACGVFWGFCFFVFFLDTEMESFCVSISEYWQQILLSAGWASFSGVISPRILRVFTRWANHTQTKKAMLIPIHLVPSTGGGSLNPFSQDVKTNQMGVLSPPFGL